LAATAVKEVSGRLSEEFAMSLPKVVSRDEWLAARRELLAREKEHTKKTDALNTARRNLPMVRIEKDYRFTGPDGEVGLLDLFKGKRQLVIQHFMFGPDWETGCPGCTAGVDEIAPGLLAHLDERDTTFVLVSRAPIEKLEAYKSERGWFVDWYSSHDSEFNYDFNVTIDAKVAPIMVNFRTADELADTRHSWVLDSANQPQELSAYSYFLRNGDDVFHTYSTFGRGTEMVGSAYGILDLSALGRQEDWEEPKGRSDKPHGADPSFGGFAA
jgi:predicted dithiol-disulfide oxidoreductase (DUF899 family)